MTDIIYVNLRNLLYLAEDQFPIGECNTKIKTAYALLEDGKYKLCQQMLDDLPTLKGLVDALIEKVRDKPVGKTLERLDTTVDWTSLKAISSLLTHAIIECEQGNLEYWCVVRHLSNQLNSHMFEIIKTNKEN